MNRVPRDVTDLQLAPVLLALDERLSELALLDVDELGQRVALETDGPDWTVEMRMSRLLDAVERFIDLHGWKLSWDPRGLRVAHGRHHVVLGIPTTFQAYIGVPTTVHV